MGKLSTYAAITALERADQFPVTDDPGGTPATKVATLETLMKHISGRYDEVFDTGGDLTLNGTTWANLDGADASRFDLVLTDVAVGDLVQIAIGGRVQAENVLQFFDVVSVGGSGPTTWGTRAAESATSGGFEGWVCPVVVITALSGGPIKAVVAGDLVGSTLTLRPRHRQSSAGNKTLFANSDHPFWLSARNLGPAL